MSKFRKVIVAGGTFSVAMSVGFIMQNGDALASLLVAEGPPAPMSGLAMNAPAEVPVMPVMPMAEAPVAPDMAMAEALALPDDIALPVMPDTPEPLLLAALEPDTALPEAIPEAALAPLDCTVSLTGTASLAATVILDVSAPCSPYTRGTLHHQGMMFTFLTDADGAAREIVPALTQEAVFIAEIATDTGGAGGATLVSVPDFDQYDRAVLQWQGTAGPELHALEFGAGYDDTGHVWSASSRDLGAAVNGTGGFLTRLGAADAENPLMAEVYTYPTGTGRQSGQVDLSVEIEVLPVNCGREIAAQTIQVSPGVDPRALDLTMTMPSCDSVGEFLILRNMLLSLTLAAR